MSSWYNYSSDYSDNKYYGLENQGATCYLNCVLQVLFMTKDFREAVLRSSGENDGVDAELKKLFTKLQQSTTDTCAITRKLGITSGAVQGDAAAFFEKVLNGVKSEEASQIFEVKLAHKIVCDICKKETSTKETFWHLPLELMDRDYDDFHVMDGIERYFSESRSTGQDQLYCEECCTKADAKLHFELQKHPEVLTLLLKRFKFNHYFRSYQKINRCVEIPFKITVEDEKYELYAIVEHSGELKGGHYSVSIKSPDDDKWYRFNDSYVSPLSNRYFQLDFSYRSWSAYLLFYRKIKVIQPQVTSEVETRDPNETDVKMETSGETEMSVKQDEDRRVADEKKEKPDSEDEGEKRESAATANKERIGTESQTDVKVRIVIRDAAADKKPVGGTKKMHTIQDLVHSSQEINKKPPARDEVKEVEMETRNMQFKINGKESQSGYYAAERVQINDGDESDQGSGVNSLSEERAEKYRQPKGEDEKVLEKPLRKEESKEVIERLLNRSRDRFSQDMKDVETRDVDGDRSVSGQEGLRNIEERRPEILSKEKTHRSQFEMSFSQSNEPITTQIAGSSNQSKAAEEGEQARFKTEVKDVSDVESLAETFTSMKLGDSASTDQQRTDQKKNVKSLNSVSENKEFERESQPGRSKCWAQTLAQEGCQSVAGIKQEQAQQTVKQLSCCEHQTHLYITPEGSLYSTYFPHVLVHNTEAQCYGGTSVAAPTSVPISHPPVYVIVNQPNALYSTQAPVLSTGPPFHPPNHSAGTEVVHVRSQNPVCCLNRIQMMPNVSWVLCTETDQNINTEL